MSFSLHLRAYRTHYGIMIAYLHQKSSRKRGIIQLSRTESVEQDQSYRVPFEKQGLIIYAFTARNYLKWRLSYHYPRPSNLCWRARRLVWPFSTRPLYTSIMLTHISCQCSKNPIHHWRQQASFYETCCHPARWQHLKRSQTRQTRTCTRNI